MQEKENGQASVQQHIGRRHDAQSMASGSRVLRVWRPTSGSSEYFTVLPEVHSEAEMMCAARKFDICEKFFQFH